MQFIEDRKCETKEGCAIRGCRSPVSRYLLIKVYTGEPSRLKRFMSLLPMRRARRRAQTRHETSLHQAGRMSIRGPTGAHVADLNSIEEQQDTIQDIMAATAHGHEPKRLRGDPRRRFA